MEEGKALEVISDAERALVQLDQEDLDRAPKLGIQRAQVRHGRFVIGDVVAGDHLDVVILDHARLHAFYRGAYVEGENGAPACYATGLRDADMAPGDVEEKQNRICFTCPAYQWPTDEEKKRGKKSKDCKTYYRVVGVTAAKQQDGTWDEVALLEIQVAPTSLKNFDSLRVRIESYRKRALRSVMTRVSLDPTSNYPIYVFEPIADIDNSPDLQGLAAFVLRYPLGKGTAIRTHLLRGWVKDADDAPVSTVGANEQSEKVDDEIPF